MGRCTSIFMVDKEKYEHLEDLKTSLEVEYDNFEYQLLLAKIEELSAKMEKNEIKYWGKSDCSEVVKFFRKFKDDDGDIIITDEIFSEIKIHLSEELSSSEFRIIEKSLKTKDLVCIYNTN